jgi:hypothetical protein
MLLLRVCTSNLDAHKKDEYWKNKQSKQKNTVGARQGVRREYGRNNPATVFFRGLKQPHQPKSQPLNQQSSWQMHTR